MGFASHACFGIQYPQAVGQSFHVYERSMTLGGDSAYSVTGHGKVRKLEQFAMSLPKCNCVAVVRQHLIGDGRYADVSEEASRKLRLTRFENSQSWIGT